MHQSEWRNRVEIITQGHTANHSLWMHVPNERWTLDVMCVVDYCSERQQNQRHHTVFGVEIFYNLKAPDFGGFAYFVRISDHIHVMVGSMPYRIAVFTETVFQRFLHIFRWCNHFVVVFFVSLCLWLWWFLWHSENDNNFKFKAKQKNRRTENNEWKTVHTMCVHAHYKMHWRWTRASSQFAGSLHINSQSILFPFFYFSFVRFSFFRLFIFSLANIVSVGTVSLRLIEPVTIRT